MVKKLLEKMLDWRRNKDASPWASFEVHGFEDDGRIKVVCNWNESFIKKINSLGFQSETEDEVVQLFFYTCMARPTELDGSNPEEAASSGHPNLSADTHQLRT